MKRELPIKFNHAEVWLDEAAQMLSHRYIRCGYITPKLRVLYGFTTSGFRRAAKHRILGQCLARSWSRNGENIIIISPHRKEAVDILTTLGHEIAHAIDDCQNNHGKEFKEILLGFGYLFSGKSDYPSRDLLDEYRSMAELLGKFPLLRLIDEI